MADNYSNLWWAVDGVLAGMGVPFVALQRRLEGGGPTLAFDDDLPILDRLGIRAVVCLLNIPTDESVFGSAGFKFLCLPVEDGRPPTRLQVDEFIRFVDECRIRGLPVAVFCEAGLGRSGTMIASYLMYQSEGAEAAIASVRARQPGAIESQAQIEFLHELEATWKREKLGL